MCIKTKPALAIARVGSQLQIGQRGLVERRPQFWLDLDDHRGRDWPGLSNG
jgi:hypothetical protein